MMEVKSKIMSKLYVVNIFVFQAHFLHTYFIFELFELF